MSADDISGIKAELDGLVREQAERRGLREKQGEEIKARSQEYMTKQVQAAERYVQHVREVGQRKTRSGWSTERNRPDSAPGFEPGFEPEGFAGEPGAGAASPFAPTPAPAPAEPRRGRRHRAAEAEEDGDAFLNNPW